MECLGLPFCFGTNEEISNSIKTGCQMSSLDVFAEMRESGEPCDFTIKVGNEQIKVHRVVLAANIPYFRRMFRSNMKECVKKEATMKAVDLRALKSVINFAYTSSLQITETNVIALLNATMYLEIDVVREACLDFMWNRINPKNALLIRMCAEFALSEEMVERVNRFVRENFAAVSLSEDFLSLPLNDVKELIRRDDLNVVNEEVVFESVLRWVEASENERTDELVELLPDVRMEQLGLKYLNSRVLPDKFIQKSSVCKDMVKKVKKLLLSPKRSSSNQIISKERFCREKHHLKCAEKMGCGMYSASLTTSLELNVNYCDWIAKKWNDLCNFHNIDLDYIACIKDNLYFIQYSSLHVLNLRTMKCSFFQIASTIFEAGITLHEEKIYFFGGYSKRRLLCFDPQNLSLSPVGRMRERRNWKRTFTLLVVKHPFSTASTQLNDMIQMQDAAITFPRAGHDFAALNGRVYVCGGSLMISERRRPTNSCEVYNPNTDQWTLIREMNTAKYRMSMVYDGQKNYIHLITNSEKYDIDHDFRSN